MQAAVRTLWVLGSLVLCVASRPYAAAAENQCVVCHEQEPQPIAFGHSFEAWRHSLHAQHDVTCEKCHGGDPAAKDRASAHAGVLPATDPKSLIDASHLGSTCGGCHDKEFAAYEKTIHSKRIQRLGKAATCMTCHDAMATSLPSPAELSSRCAACHEEPLEAHIALVTLAGAKSRLSRTRRDIEAMKAVDPDWHRNALERLRDLDERYHRIQLEWHTFAVQEVLRDSRDVLALGKLLNEEALKRAAMQRREGRGAATPGSPRP